MLKKMAENLMQLTCKAKKGFMFDARSMADASAKEIKDTAVIYL